MAPSTCPWSSPSRTDETSCGPAKVVRGAEHWMHVLTEIQHRGVDDVLMQVCDGLKGWPDAVRTVWPSLPSASARFTMTDVTVDEAAVFARWFGNSFVPAPRLAWFASSLAVARRAGPVAAAGRGRRRRHCSGTAQASLLVETP
ncbi:transposase [Streptomyces lydicus]|uniref:transposase n=1 Tax=Streptomyces lydicus TaxID=47763 RepID=UPI0037B8A766